MPPHVRVPTDAPSNADNDPGHSASHFTTTTIERPPIAESSGAEWTSFQAWKDAAGSTTILAGCVATPIPGWVEDMRPAVEGRTIALAGAACRRATHEPIETRAADGALILHRVAPSGMDASANRAPEVLGIAKTFIGFDDSSRVVTCFAGCVTKSIDTRPSAPCDAAIRGAVLEGDRPPPRPSWLLEGVTWSIHHPRPFVATGAAIVSAIALLAIVSRRRPRFRGSPARDES